MKTLWHYTCDHGQKALSGRGLLLPPFDQQPDLVDEVANADLVVLLSLIWMTDLPAPDRLGLGLTSYAITCNRTRYRYRVTDAADAVPYWAMAHSFGARFRADLESAPGARPSRWWTSTRPVPVVYDPIPEVTHGQF